MLEDKLEDAAEETLLALKELLELEERLDDDSEDAEEKLMLSELLRADELEDKLLSELPDDEENWSRRENAEELADEEGEEAGDDLLEDAPASGFDTADEVPWLETNEEEA